MIDFKQLEAFVWVAELGGFRLAAEKLNTTQPSISQRIAALESIMSVRLFERGTRGIKLTEKGQELLSHAQRMLEMRNDMMRVAKRENAIRGIFRLGVAETLVHTWLHELIDLLHQQFPALVVEIHVDTSSVLRNQLAAYQIDLALLVGQTSSPKEHALSLCEYDLVWVSSPRLKLHGRKIEVADLGVFPVITYPSGSFPYCTVRDLLQQAKVKAPRIYGSASLSTIIKMTNRAMGPSLLARVVIEEELALGKLCLLDVNAPPSSVHFYACWVDSPDSHAVHTIAKLAQQVAQQNITS